MALTSVKPIDRLISGLAAFHQMAAAPRLGLVFAILAALLFRRLPRSLPGVRLAIFIAVFVLARDAMTTTGVLVDSGMAGPFLSPSPPALFGLAAVCAAATAWLYVSERELRSTLAPTRPSLGYALLVAAIAAAVMVAPVAASSLMGDVIPDTASLTRVQLFGFSPTALTALAFFSLAEGTLEEVLFRGYLTGLLARGTNPKNARFLSTVLFTLCHVELAVLLSRAGLQLLLFVFWQGLVASYARSRSGLVASSLAHAMGLFALASGYF